MKKIDEKQLKEPEEFILVQDILVREHGQVKAVGKKAGTKVLLSGMDKAELMFRGIAVKAEDYKADKKSAVKTDDKNPDKK